MKKSLRSVFGFFAALSLFLFASCEVGLGESVDLEAPEITITSPLPNAKVGCNVTLEGTCSDNVAVTEVIVSNNITGEVYGNASISHDAWSISLDLEEGEVELKCQVKDRADNASSKSVRTILLLVDETAPDGLSWYIERGAGIQIALESKEKLVNKDLTSAENKYVPQNQEFTIYGNFYDAMSIDTISLVLYEDDLPVITKTVTAEDKEDGNYIGEGKSIFAPSFHFDHDELVAAKASLATGKHYLQLYYYTTDDHKNSAEKRLQYLLWYPESDYPGIQQSATVSDMLFVTVGSSIPLHFFDDDELAEVGYDLRRQTDCTGITLDNLRSNITDKITTISGKTDYPVQISAGEVKDFFKLLAYAKDVNGKESTRIIDVAVSDNTSPMLIIESPQENSIPSMHDGTKFDITGYSYDSSGSNSVKIAYIPSGNIQTRAQALFNGGTPAAGELYDSYTFPLTKTKLAGDIWYKESFSFEFDLSDFGNNAKENKTFVIQLEDTDGNIVLKTFSVHGDNIDPVIDINSPSTNGVVCDYSNHDLILKFKATKSNGLGINSSKYSIKRKNHTEEWTLANNGLTGPDSDGYVTATILKSTLQNWAETEVDVQPVFIFSAEDILENKSSDQRTVILSPLPTLEKVTVDKVSGTYPAGTKLTIQAKFTDSVKVTGSPRILLGGISGGINSDGQNVSAHYANYTTGTGTDTLSFEYTVLENAATPSNGKVTCSGTGIDLNGGKIETGVAGTGDATVTFVSGANFWDADTAHSDVAATIKVDGVKPSISSISVYKIDGENPVTDTDGKYYCNKNREILLNIAFSEAVTVSGSPVLTVGGVDFSFQSINGVNAQFLHKVVDDENVTITTYNYADCFTDDDRDLITDSTGNALKEGSGTGTLNLVLDTTRPGAPSVSGTLPGGGTISTGGVYNKKPTITVTKASTDNDIKSYQYSTDGGLTWNDYDATNKPELAGGAHNIVARVTDKAGNVSANSTPISITINLSFPNLLEISIAKVDGKYKAGDTVEFKVFLDDVVEPYSAGAATIKFKGITKANTDSDKRTVNVDASSIETNKLTFTYTVGSTDDFEGVQITDLDFGSIKDRYNNYGTDNTDQITDKLAESTAHRSGLILDGKAPVVSHFILNNNEIATQNAWQSYSAGTDKVSSSPNTAKNFVIKLKFNEGLVKESGTIILQRKGNWAIPPVMDSTTFLKWYNKMSVANREKLMITTSGNGSGGEKLDTQTGQPVGPYKKITHGLKESGSTLIPDTATKYVLDFQYGLYDDNANSTVVSDIRSALKSVDYDKHTVEVRDVTLSSSETDGPTDILTITFPDAIEDGQNWELIIPGNSFHDAAGNYFAGFKAEGTTGSAGSFSLWSNKVAKPVVRVDRYSHGMGAVGLDTEGNETPITGWTAPMATTYDTNSGSNLMPLGYAKVRIDCETPGAKIYYKNETSGTADSDDYKWASKNGGINENNELQWSSDQKNEDDSHKSSISDIAKTSLIFSTGGTEYTTTINIGDISSEAVRYKTARKDYVSAYASKTGYTISENGYEGIFKTVVILYKNNTDNQINIEGGTAEGGEPIVSGFPVRDATSEHRYAKNAYHFTENFTYTITVGDKTSNPITEENANFFAWVSYEIISDWAILQHRDNYSSKYPKHSYGQLIFLSNYSDWE